MAEREEGPLLLSRSSINLHGITRAFILIVFPIYSVRPNLIHFASLAEATKHEPPSDVITTIVSLDELMHFITLLLKVSKRWKYVCDPYNN